MRLKLEIVVLAALAVASCAVAAQPLGPTASAAERGHAIAERTCNRCHGIAAGDDSRNAGAPRFVTIAGRYNELSLEERLGQISTSGHYEMPPQQLSPSEIRDLVAYIQGLPQP